MNVLNHCHSPKAAESLNGIRMEMTDAAFPLLKGVVATTDVEVCKDVNIAVILGGYPWKKIMLRKDMLSTNVFIYKAQALALEEHAADAKTIQITKVLRYGVRDWCYSDERYASILCSFFSFWCFVVNIDSYGMNKNAEP
ncbi:malate dehydrogenase [Quercus suber]|uniref:Malate dehydrogenase n=1 Tax=Quercus suber TaxID=58331 RepID=A0AAW0MB21_QUESU